MNHDFDDLMRTFAHAQLGDQAGTLAEIFRPAPPRIAWRSALLPLAIAAGFLLAIGLTVRGYPTQQANHSNVALAPDSPESITDEVWYRDIPGQTILLEDNTPAQIVYSQIYQIRTTVSDQGKEISTQAIPTDLIALVTQPVF